MSGGCIPNCIACRDELPPVRFELGDSTGRLLTDGRTVVNWELATLAPTQQQDNQPRADKEHQGEEKG
jgi:hypothetical protein